jgi:hypothetical protein
MLAQGLGQDGIDLLTMAINEVFDVIVTHILSWGGDVVKFAGDAVICTWEAPNQEDLGEAVRRAVSCAMDLESKHSTFKVRHTRPHRGPCVCCAHTWPGMCSRSPAVRCAGGGAQPGLDALLGPRQAALRHQRPAVVGGLAAFDVAR